MKFDSAASERIPSSPPKIEPILGDEPRPKWSVMIPVYNCAAFFPSAIESVLAQDLGPEDMQIEVIDDASTDVDVESLVIKIGKGRVGYFRQPENVGSLRNFETCINRSRGKLLHLLHGDDRVKVGFYTKIGSLLDSHPEAGAAFCKFCFIDKDGKTDHHSNFRDIEDGILKNGLLEIAIERPIQYVSIVVKRKVYEDLGSFYGVVYGEDWEMWVRIAQKLPIAYTPEILAEYRIHEGSISWLKEGNGQNTRDLATTIARIECNLPSSIQSKFSKTKKEAAFYCIAQANMNWKQFRNTKVAGEQIRIALSLNKSLILYYHIMKFYIKVFFKIY
ncbi:glycosyltransferase family 2 protein [Cognataquiflexum rubidum]|uniref:glycosyltransferase family 2 protein n=1 Tax=Cognataquiflexum rubidum TaxID=2922273 RepID=UPI001F141D78|nr:glycosyltransferase [Cognataquiflexum rubidum]MCH6234046.1 glycosyltransferase [Cognataquiflexum rubidum]